VGPGQMLAIDTETAEVLHTQDIDQRLKTAQPYKRWMRENALRVETTLNQETPEFKLMEPDELLVHQKMFNVSFEERDQVLRPLAEGAQEAVGSMGDDTPMAVLSSKVRHVADYFRQKFAQVTNPPIDPLRETIVMSLETCLGAEKNVFEGTPEHARRIVLTTPVLSPAKYLKLANNKRPGFEVARIGMSYRPEEGLEQAARRVCETAAKAVRVGPALLILSDKARPGFEVARIAMSYRPEEGLEQAVRRVCETAAKAVRGGKVLLILSDKDLTEGELPVNAVMATAAVHQHLVANGLRCDSNIIVET